MPNLLARETSPYLRQHAENPVAWRPWGEEAFEKARREDKPIFLSIGYAACHWCHVMERESFEDPEIAAFVNEHFVPVKVDREERPDVDEIYMNAVQAMTGHGGWPLTAFLTPRLEPFYGGTYFPPRARWGRPGFLDLCRAIAEAWETRREACLGQAGELAAAIAALGAAEVPAGRMTLEHLRGAALALRRLFDERHGGFGSAPKFPHAMDVLFLLRWHRRSGAPRPQDGCPDPQEGCPEALRMATATLAAMARGGIHDHLGGGFHRYATDEEWLVPHFEKMLYDQALLVLAYVDGWRASADPLFERAARGACDFVLRELAHADGGFFSSLDADSEGEEGRFYVWTADEVRDVLGGDFEAFAAAYDVTDAGNWEGKTILRQVCDEAEAARLAGARARLLEARGRRVRPGLDDKVIASWNGLMIGALAEAGFAFGETRYVEAARRAARFVLGRMRSDGRLLRVWAPATNEAKIDGLLEDHAYVAEGLCHLHAATGEAEWMLEADRLVEAAEDLWDEASGLYFAAPARADLIARSRSPHDGATPSPNASMAHALVRIGRTTGRPGRLERAGRILDAVAPMVERAPPAFAAMLRAADLYLPPHREVVLAGLDLPGGTDLLRAAGEAFAPETIVTAAPSPWPTTAGMAAMGQGPHEPGREAAMGQGPHEPGREAAMGQGPHEPGRRPAGGSAAAYVCSNFACEPPLTDPAALRAALARYPAA